MLYPAGKQGCSADSRLLTAGVLQKRVRTLFWMVSSQGWHIAG